MDGIMKTAFNKSPGYRVKSPIIYRLWNFSISFFLLLLTLPLFIVISILLLATQGTNIFYSGPRYGKNRKIYQMYKFRTLATNAAELTRDRLMTTRTNLETPLGKVLRRTRLDELPQLYNVLRGDMNLVGPRPVRPEMFTLISKDVANYSIRFETKPGLVGVAQSLLPHSAPKILRHRLNVILLKREVSLCRELFFLFRNGLAVLQTVAEVLLERILHVKAGYFHNRRNADRSTTREAEVALHDTSGILALGTISDINDEAFSFLTTQKLNNGSFKAIISLKNRRKISVICEINSQPAEQPEPGSDGSHFRRYVAFFRYQNALETYRIEHHLLQKALIS